MNIEVTSQELCLSCGFCCDGTLFGSVPLAAADAPTPLQAAGIQVIQCTLTSVGEKHDGTNANDAKLEEFAQIEREVAKAKNVPLNDLRNAFVAHWRQHNPDNKPSGILTYDGNHFTQAGHEFVAAQMLKKFK